MTSEEMREKLEKIKLAAFDIDGTMTDGAMYYSRNGEELKRFSTRDGMGITLLQKSNIQTAFITSENSPIVLSRAEKLKIDFVYTSCRNKTGALDEICEKTGLKLENIAFIGDDVNDYHAIKYAGFGACPNDANELIKEASDYISKYNGGNGTVREICEMILLNQNRPITLNENW